MAEKYKHSDANNCDMNIIRPPERPCPDKPANDSCCPSQITPATTVAPLTQTASNQDTIRKINEILNALKNAGLMYP